MKSNWKTLFATFVFGALVAQSLPGGNSFPEFQQVNIGGSAGKFVQQNGAFHVENSTTNQGLSFVFTPLNGNGQITARVRHLSPALAKAGVIFRQNTNADSLSAAMFLNSSNTIFERVTTKDAPTSSTIHTNETYEWLRVVREGNAVSGFGSTDGTNWTQLSADTIEMSEPVVAGMAMEGTGRADFDQFSLTSAQLVEPSKNATFTAPATISNQTKVVNSGASLERIEFFENSLKIGEATAPPYSLVWSNAWAGNHSLVAKVTDQTGAEFFTEPVECEVKLPTASASFVEINETVRGNWREHFGQEGFVIAGSATNLPTHTEFSILGHKTLILTYDNDPSALRMTNGTGSIVSQWFTPTDMTFQISLRDGATHRIVLYFHDWRGTVRVENVELIDAEKHKLLDARRVSNFQDGKYFIWNVRGKIQIRITRVAGPPSVVNGIFLDRTER